MLKKCLLIGGLLVASLAGFAQEGSVEMVLVEGGSFTMGNDYSLVNGQNVVDETPEHKVTLNSFYMSKTEVTFEMFDLFCEATGFKKPENGGNGTGKLPVVNVSWESAIMFCNWLSKKDHYDPYYKIDRDSVGSIKRITTIDGNNGYRLPTEAEWEYAAKGGKDSKFYAYSGSNDFSEVAWCRANSNGIPHEVATKKPNEIGIYDLNGNAWEWVWDWYKKDYYKSAPESNPTGPASGSEKVYRGGNWSSNKEFLRLTSRYHTTTKEDKDYGMIGIRLARNAN